jgi:hypothetical protein
LRYPADHHDQRNLHDLLQRYGIDVDKYFAFGLDIFIGETLEDDLATPYVYVLVIDKKVVGGDSVETIQNYIDEHSGILPYVKIKIEIDLKDILRYFKRINIVLENSYLTRVREFRETEI